MEGPKRFVVEAREDTFLDLRDVDLSGFSVVRVTSRDRATINLPALPIDCAATATAYGPSIICTTGDKAFNVTTRKSGGTVETNAWCDGGTSSALIYAAGGGPFKHVARKGQASIVTNLGPDFVEGELPSSWENAQERIKIAQSQVLRPDLGLKMISDRQGRLIAFVGDADPGVSVFLDEGSKMMICPRKDVTDAVLCILFQEADSPILAGITRADATDCIKRNVIQRKDGTINRIDVTSVAERMRADFALPVREEPILDNEWSVLLDSVLAWHTVGSERAVAVVSI